MCRLAARAPGRVRIAGGEDKHTLDLLPRAADRGGRGRRHARHDRAHRQYGVADSGQQIRAYGPPPAISSSPKIVVS